MSENNQRKAVYFAANELELKLWAEHQPGGFSAYIKRLIIEDLNIDQQKGINEILDEIIHSKKLANFIQDNIKAALEGKITDVKLETQLDQISNISNDEADVIMELIDL